MLNAQYSRRNKIVVEFGVQMLRCHECHMVQGCVLIELAPYLHLQLEGRGIGHVAESGVQCGGTVV